MEEGFGVLGSRLFLLVLWLGERYYCVCEVWGLVLGSVCVFDFFVMCRFFFGLLDLDLRCLFG